MKRKKTDEELAEQYRLERFMVRKILREMCYNLSGTEASVLWFIFERIYTYGNREAAISENHFLEGVWKDDTFCIVPPLKMSSSSLYRAIRSLKKHGMIFVEPGKKYATSVYSINENYTFQYCHPRQSRLSPMTSSTVTHDSLKLREYKIRENKPLKRARARECARDKPAHTGDENVFPTENVNKQENVNMPTPMERVKAAAAAATQKTATARTKNKQKGNASSYAKIWQDAQREINGGEKPLAWTGAELRMFRIALDRGVPAEHREAFIKFAVTEYSEILKRFYSVGFALRTGGVPKVPIVVKHIAEFWEAYLDHLNPNRVLEQRIAKSYGARKSDKVEQPDTDDAAAKLKELQAANEKLKADNVTLATALKKASLHSHAPKRRSFVRKPRTAKPDEEFGEWRD